MIITETLETIHDNVLITDMNFEEQVSAGGIIIKSDDGTSEGIRPRWGQVYKIGPEQQDVSVGDWILIEHGRWTRGVKVKKENGDIVTVRRVDNKAILAVSNHLPSDVNIGLSNPSTEQTFDFSQPMY
jgi:co-chaperonin GroES (HSP10)